MNLLLLASHAVAEHDDIRMFTDMGHDVFCPGGYADPTNPGEGIRPGIPNAPVHADLIEACEAVRAEMGEPGRMIDWAKAQLPMAVIEWADVIICHHFPEVWLYGQWQRIRHRRVVWRTCGQSSPGLEALMGTLDGLQVVRYSPAEQRHFEALGQFAGQDALIRFGKYPDDYGPWIGDLAVVGNITQHMAQRGDACGYGFWEAATEGLPTAPAGPGSETLRGGVGSLPYPAMLSYLRHAGAYLYTGTRPASYTLGLIEAMLSGVPVVSIGARAWGDGWGGAPLFEAATVETPDYPNGLHREPSIVAADMTFDDPAKAGRKLRDLLEHPDMAAAIGQGQRARAVAMFGIDTISAQWASFLG